MNKVRSDKHAKEKGSVGRRALLLERSMLPLRAQPKWTSVVVIVELSRQTIGQIGVCCRQLGSVGQAVEFVLAVQEHGAIDIHDGGAVDAGPHESVQLCG